MIYLLIGPSGSGKTTFGSCLRDLDIPELISTTTREPREGESFGSPYYFVKTLEEFAEIPMIESTEYAGNYYGTSITEVRRILSSGKPSFAIVDRHGVEAFRAIYGDMVKVIYIYVHPEAMVERMKARGDSEYAILERLIHAKESGEFDNMDIADYCIINKNLDDALRQLRAIVNL